MRPFGIYVHVPFCSSKCDYCAFATWTDRVGVIDDYLDAVAIEVDRARSAGLADVTSIFVGGGTPSLLGPQRLSRLLRMLPRTRGAEITVECNPDDVTADLVAAIIDAGGTRVSLGVQSAVPHVLRSLGRSHDVDHVRVAIDLVRSSSLASFNVDLIYGAVGETLDDWISTLDAILATRPPHVAAYALTPEPGTPLARDRARHPIDDDLADKYLVLDERLAAAGLANYEISNWARRGHESRHNRLYWCQGDYRGFGCAAHSHQDGHRWWNVRTPERYIARLRDGRSPIGGDEHHHRGQRLTERLQLELRTRDGVERAAFDEDTIAWCSELLRPHPELPERVVLTRSGRLLADEIAVRMRPASPADATVGAVAVGVGGASVRAAEGA
ncbi:MAG: radical SAM family heme chaperone HemW [Actinomycetota bacterium]